MLNVHHLSAGAARGTPLVIDDRDRFELVRAIVEALGEHLLAYCLMDTHVHVVAEGAGPTVCTVLAEALRVYARGFNSRRGYRGRLRGPVSAVQCPGPEELAAQIRYVHENPIKVERLGVKHEVAWQWSSARAYAGLSRAAYPNVERARALMERFARRARPPWCPALAGLEPMELPTVSGKTILVASAQTFDVSPEELVDGSRSTAVSAARRVFAALGRLEGYSDGQLALVMARTRGRITQLALGALDIAGVRIARTLFRYPELNARLPRETLTETVRIGAARDTRGPQPSRNG